MGYSPQFVLIAIVVPFSYSIRESPVHVFLVVDGHCPAHFCIDYTGTPLVHAGLASSNLPDLMAHLEGTVQFLLRESTVGCTHSDHHFLALFHAQRAVLLIPPLLAGYSKSQGIDHLATHQPNATSC